MSKSQKANFFRTDLSLAPNPVLPEVDEKIQQAITRLLGWDTNNELWRSLLTDQDGRLLVSTSVTQGQSAVQTAVSVGVATVQLIGINTSRRLIMIQNLGAAAIYINFGNPGSLTTGFQIPSNGVFIDDHFLGAINAISAAAANDVRVTEF